MWALVSIVEDWLLGEIQGTPEELIRFVDQVAGTMCVAPGSGCPRQVPGRRSLLEPDHCAGPVSQIKGSGFPERPGAFFRCSTLCGQVTPAHREARDIARPRCGWSAGQGVAVQMADHPAGIHLEARRHCLGDAGTRRDGGEAVVHALEYLVPHKTGAEALRPVELEVIALRLGVPVGQIAGPVPRSFSTSPSTILDQGAISLSKMVFTRRWPHCRTCPRRSRPRGVLRPVQPAGERCVILRALDQDLPRLSAPPR